MRLYPRSSIFYALLLLAGGCGIPSFLITPVQNTNELEEVTVKAGRGWSQGKIAIIEVEGMLINIKHGGFLSPTENPVSLFVQELERAQSDPNVRAVVLRINSPGGSVTGSDIMYQELLRFRKETHKPVVASTQELCASGGYYVACGADKIIAHPTSVVGSIGVLFQTFDIENGLAKIGVRAEAIKSAPLKDMGSPFHHLSDEERRIMQEMVDAYFERFKSIVAGSRRITDPAVLEVITDGRVFTGTDAVRLGLADANGLLDDAITSAKEMAKAPGAKVIMYKRPYGYSGSIYASHSAPPPQAQGTTFNVNIAPDSLLPSGFYYLWRP